MNEDTIRILIADDELSVRHTLLCELTAKGYKCSFARNGNSILDEMDTRRFDVALLDIKLTGKSSSDILKQVQIHYPDTAIIVMTAIADVETAVKSMKLGACDYMIKPVDPNMLVVSIDQALDKRRLMLENKNYQFHLEEKVEEQGKNVDDLLKDLEVIKGEKKE